MLLLVLYVVVAIGVSFVCSVLEAVLLSVTPAYVGSLESRRPAAAARLRALKEDVDRPLAAILSLNTIAHTIGAVGAGAQATEVFGSAWVGAFSAVLTLAILVLSEIVPKTIGATYWRRLAPLSGRVLRVMILLLLPLVWLSQWITRLIAPDRRHTVVSRDELAAMADIGARQGVVEEREARTLKSLLRFKELFARDVMTPRAEVAGFPETTTVRDAAGALHVYSRLPLFDGERVTGFVLRDELLERAADGADGTLLVALRRDVLAVTEDLPLSRLFNRLLARREHLAVVVEQGGRMSGVVTMEDIVESLLGLEIFDEVDPDAEQQAPANA